MDLLILSEHGMLYTFGKRYILIKMLLYFLILIRFLIKNI